MAKKRNKNQLKLGKAEWEVMDTIWSLKGQPSVREVLDTAYPNKEKAYTTVQTTMNNIAEKGYLRRIKIGAVNFYKPLIKREDLIQGETFTFVNKVFNGSFLALANHLFSSDSFSDEELENLKRILQQK
ncbi:BlaI/MecI/CopY family transcriptional regulator [candidate division KSB1 bacterium]